MNDNMNDDGFYPYFDVRLIGTEWGVRVFKIQLSRANFDYLFAGCPHVDRLIGECDEPSALFEIYPNPIGEMQQSFSINGNNQSYFMYVGAPVPTIPQDANEKEFESLYAKAYQNLEHAINDSGRIPILDSGNVHLGDVLMSVLKE